MGYKIREAQNEKTPYMVIIGEKEESSKKITVRSRTKGDEGQSELKALIDRLTKQIQTKAVK